jgi:hypothetical protein
VRARRHHHPADRAASPERLQDGVAAVQQLARRPRPTCCRCFLVALVPPPTKWCAPPGRSTVSVIAVAARWRPAVALVAVTPGRTAIVVAATSSTTRPAGSRSARSEAARTRTARIEPAGAWPTRSKSARTRTTLPWAAPAEAAPADAGAAGHQPARTHRTVLARTEGAATLARRSSILVTVTVAEITRPTPIRRTGPLAASVVARAPWRAAPVEGARPTTHDALVDVHLNADLFASVRDHPIVVTLSALPWRLSWGRLPARFCRRLATALAL